MRLKFEQLEQRLALSGISFTIDGPDVAYIGDEVQYKVIVTNRDEVNHADPKLVSLSFISERSFETEWQWQLDDVHWQLDGAPWRQTEDGIRLGPGETRVFTGVARVTDDVEYFQLFVFIDRADAFQTVVLDTFVDAGTIGGAAAWNADFGIEITMEEQLQSVEPAGDLNGDGFGDAYIVTIGEHYTRVGDDWKFVFQRFRHTALGTETSMEIIPRERLLLETSEPFDDRPSSRPEEWLPAASSDGGRWSIGDVDGDGYEDEFVGRPENLQELGTGSLLFGPDHRENFVIVSNQLKDIAIPTGGEGQFGVLSGTLGDVNGDGFGDFYVLSTHWSGEGLYVLHGRDFGRDLPADIDRNGTVDFADFLVLAYNYGNENATRSEGDLDGDGLVAFSDFIVLRDTFGQSKADVPLASG